MSRAALHAAVLAFLAGAAALVAPATALAAGGMVLDASVLPDGSANTEGRSLRTDGERYAAWQRISGITALYDARTGRKRYLTPAQGFELAAVGGGLVVWQEPSTGAVPNPLRARLQVASLSGGQPAAPVSFIATYGSGPLCPFAGQVYAGITGAGAAGVIVSCTDTRTGVSWRFSVDPATGTSTAPRFAPAELAGKAWDWNANLPGIQALACPTVAAAPVFQDGAGPAAALARAYEAPFGAAPRWDGARRRARPGAELWSCTRARPQLLERTGSPTGWQFGGEELSWTTVRRDRRGRRTDTVNLYDLRRGRFEQRIAIRRPRRVTITTGHVRRALLIQTKVSLPGQRARHEVRLRRAR